MGPLSRLRQRLRARLWFWPGIAAIGAFVAARLLAGVDRMVGWERDTWYLFGGSAESARTLLSTVSSSMMTFTGLVFSITILVLQLASAQFSPRVLRTFLEDRNSQLAMAAFVGTFVYALALLPVVRGGGQEAAPFVPGLALFVAFALVLFSVGVFVHYIDHMAHSIRAVSLVKRVSADTRVAIATMYPDELPGDPEPEVAAPTGHAETLALAGRAGVLAAVDENALMAAACAADGIVALIPSPGDFVPRGAPLARIWGGDEQLAAAVRAAVAIEDERTSYQDPSFGFRQLVDIAERALSPGVNDPSTAVQVLDELHDLLRWLATRRFPSPYGCDPQGRLRVILPRPDWDAYVDLALDEIMQYGAASLQVVARVRTLLADVRSVASPARRVALDRHRARLDDQPAAAHRGGAAAP
jgi:uncharacterized membrane protein